MQPELAQAESASPPDGGANDVPLPLVAIRNLTKYYTRGEQVIPVLVDINIDVMAGDLAGNRTSAESIVTVLHDRGNHNGHGVQHNGGNGEANEAGNHGRHGKQGHGKQGLGRGDDGGHGNSGHIRGHKSKNDRHLGKG